MQAYLDLTVKETYWEASKEERKGIRDSVTRIWSTLRNTITKYITYDKDAIFKDRNWPHLWS
ncbi:MAG: hypothetical protein A2Y59_01335 [Chloroflexi bacterium RBG_13_52_14]|nr:MAG: hypothetical protein A2Y59_01335 [Chloroflexi bacterium RBG_13_52_14]